MVLETASSETFSEPTPSSSSEADPYDSTASRSSLPFSVDISSLPKGFILSRLSEQGQLKWISERYNRATMILGRPPTPDEINAIVYHDSKMLAIVSYGLPVGAAAGLYRTWTTRKTMKWPFLKPDPATTYNVFPSKSMPLLRGVRAQMAFNAARGSLFVGMGAIACQMLFGSYAASVGSVGVGTDPRLKDYTKKLIEFSNQRRNEARAQMQKRMEGQAGEVPKGGEGQERGDGASPTSGGFEEDYGSGKWEGASDRNDTGVMDDAQMVRQEQSQNQNQSQQSQQSPTGQAGSKRTSAWTRRPPPQQSSDQSSDQSSQSQPQIFDDFDYSSNSSNPDNDASPSSQPRGTSGGSTWDRIRRERSTQSSSSQTGSSPTRRGFGTGRSPQSSQQEPEQDSSRGRAGESYSFSKGDEEKQLAKEQAQKEFDLMVERERRGEEGASAQAQTGGWRRR